MGLCSSRPWILQHLAMHMSRCCSFSIVACALHMTPLAAQVSSTGRSLAVHYRPRVTNASCTSPIQKVGISATVSSGGYITFVDYCRINSAEGQMMSSAFPFLYCKGFLSFLFFLSKQRWCAASYSLTFRCISAIYTQTVG